MYIHGDLCIIVYQLYSYTMIFKFSSHRQVLYEAHHLFFTHTIIHKLHCLVGLLMCVLARFTLIYVAQYTFTMLVANAHMYFVA